jgi:hypothetical protein
MVELLRQGQDRQPARGERLQRQRLGVGVLAIPESFDSVQASFTISATLAQPAAITVSYWDGSKYVPVRNLSISRATASNQPTTLSFAPVRSSQVRVDMTSAAPGTAAGFLQIVELQVLSGGTAVS